MASVPIESLEQLRREAAARKKQASREWDVRLNRKYHKWDWWWEDHPRTAYAMVIIGTMFVLFLAFITWAIAESLAHQ